MIAVKADTWDVIESQQSCKSKIAIYMLSQIDQVRQVMVKSLRV